MYVIEDYREYAKQFYLIDKTTDKSFETDLQIMSRINTSLKRIKAGHSGVRLLMNQVITWFNLFEREAAIRLLISKIDEDNKSALITVLALMDYIPINFAKELCQSPIDSRIAGMVYVELRGTHGQIDICTEQKYCA